TADTNTQKRTTSARSRNEPMRAELDVAHRQVKAKRVGGQSGPRRPRGRYGGSMSQENVEIATRWYEPAASKRQLLAAMPRTMELCHPRVEWTVPEDGTTYRGREGVSQRLKEWLES